MDIEVDGTEFSLFADRIAKAPSLLQKELELALQRSGLAVVTYARPLAPVDRGQLRASITNQVRFPEANIGSNLVYAPVMEHGRSAGARMPPVAAIAAWLGRVGGDPSAAFVVARAIGRNGIQGKKFLATGLQQARPQITTEFQMAIRRVIQQVV